MHRDGGEHAEHQSDHHVACSIARNRRRQNETTIAQIDFTPQRDALARAGQRTEHREIPKQDLKEERQVTDQLDIRASIQLGESRAIPTRKPMMVASTMPMPATSSVLRSPTRNTRP